MHALRLFALLFALGCAVVSASFPSRALAQGEDGYALMASDQFDDVTHGIEVLALSGDPRAATVIGALNTGDLYTGQDGKLYIHGDAGYLDARTGAAAPDVTDDMVTGVLVNNAVRRAADAAMGSLALFSPDYAVRAEGAEAVFKSRDPAAIPALDRALAVEKDASVKRVMQQARAAALLTEGHAPEAERLAAVQMLSTPPGQRVAQPAGIAVRPTTGSGRRDHRRGCRHRPLAAAVERRARRVLRPQPGLGAAAGCRRPGDHLRRHGRDQHGTWRDGHARRLHDLRRPGRDPLARPRTVRRQPADFRAAGRSPSAGWSAWRSSAA